ncbi:Type 1 glutamine amidotransferase-like domain-containing protein [Patescibacteria group bacterium]|nr:Type 1 glutamine amidotransferase-like domain-containing protein [Patescibacteria group bacterium]
MQNIKENNRIYLSGGGNEKQSFPLDKFFFSTLPKNGRFLYIPIALRGHKLYPTAHLWMNSITELHERADTQFETVDDPSKYTLETLKEFNGIYIGGGNTWSLMQELKNSGFADILIQYIEAGGQVYGGSAGAIIMGKKINTHDDENKIGLEDVSGFNLLNNFSVACHFKDEQNDRFRTWAIDNNLPIVCLPEESGLVIENGSALCAGTKSCVIYLADGTKRELNPEESFNL